MANRIWAFRAAIGLGAFLILVAVWHLLTPSPRRAGARISTYSGRRIEAGMSRAQVEDILGGPAGDYRTPPLRPADEAIIAALPPGERWQGDRHSVYVSFDAGGRVASVTDFYPGPMPSGWYRCLQGWIPLPD